MTIFVNLYDKVVNAVVQIQEFRTGATRQAMETTKSKEDCKDLRITVTDLRDKINDLDNKVCLLALFNL